MRALQSKLSLLGIGFKAALAFWLADALAVIGLREHIIQLYENSRFTPSMANSRWVFVPIGMIMGLLVGAVVVLMPDDSSRDKQRMVIRFTTFGAALLGAVYLVVWFLQMVVDIRAI